MRTLKTHHKHPEGKVFAWMALINGLGIGLIYPIFPTFAKYVLHTESAVSIFYAAMAVMMFVAALGSTIIFSRVARTTITKASLLVCGLVFFSFILVTSVGELAVLESVRVWVFLFIIMTLALFVRDFSRSRNLGETEGKFYRYSAIGLLAGPLIGGVLATLFGHELVFILAAMVLFGGLGFFYHLHIIQQHPAIVNAPQHTALKIFSNVKKFFRERGQRRAYFISLAFMSWTAFKLLYIPLYIVRSGYLESLTGIILALSIVPLILMEVKVGQFADKHGMRIPVSLGFLIMGVLSVIVFASPFDFLNFFILALINVGGAMVEPMQEYTLFQALNKDEENELYGVYMTADPVAYFLTPALGAVVLAFLPFKFLFLFFGIVMLAVSGLNWISLKRT